MENGRSFFDILFDQDNSTYLYDQQLQHSIQYKSTKDSTSDKKEGTTIEGGVNNLIKSIVPTKQHDKKEKYPNADTKHKNTDKSINNPSNTTEQEKQPQPYESLWQASSQQEGRR